MKKFVIVALAVASFLTTVIPTEAGVVCTTRRNYDGSTTTYCR